MHDRAENNNRDSGRDELSEKFTLEFTKEEGMLLLTSAKLLDKLVAGVTIHAQERDQLIKEIIEKIAGAVSPEVSKVSGELAEAIVDSVMGADELDDDYSYVSDALGFNLVEGDSFLDTYSEEEIQSLRRSIAEDAGRESEDFNFERSAAQLNLFQPESCFDSEQYAQIDFPMYAIDETLPVLENAMINHLCVRAQYYSFARESVDTITLNPLVILKEQGNWRMVAFCHELSELLLFRVDRIKEIIETAQSFEAPKDVSQISYRRLPVYS
ncbi:MAG: WYL domain-containing protein [Candidatus Melainabacteria bacterium]|nr:WYL domain-containing protein [Candidatus Melainabacteria bacterium]